jgi:hypothetical protein
VPFGFTEGTPRRRGRCAQKLLGHERDAIDDLGDTLRIRVDSVGLVECRDAGHAFEEEAIEQPFMLRRPPRVDGVELPPVLRSQVGRRPHSRQQRRQSSGIQFAQYGVEVGRGGLRRQASENVVSSQLDEHRIRPILGLAAQARQPRRPASRAR